MTRWFVRVHKWLALIVGIQIFLWVLGGLAMSLMDLERVRAEHTIAPAPSYALPLSDVLTPERAAAVAGLARIDEAALVRWADGPVWRFQGEEGVVVVDAMSGLRLTPIDAARAAEIARAGYAGQAPVTAVEYFAEPTVEYRREGAAWRVGFDDGEGTRIYVDAASGAITARRNDLWRVFDVFWTLHIMDYGERSNINNPLLQVFAGVALITVLAGLGLLIQRMQRLVRAELAARRRRRNALARVRPQIRDR
ncbi:MAG: PepSY domain-containing protein [Oceanicaulis sp.]